MDQVKIGKFIAERRKLKNLTQMQLAEKLNITDRAISKWETGKGMPDSSVMLELCNELNITVNELLSGEVIKMENYDVKAEEKLLEMARREEVQNKKMMIAEIVMGTITMVSFLTIMFLLAYVIEDTTIWTILFVIAFAILIVGVSFALKIETEVGYYECQKCHHKYVPKYKKVYFALHFGTTRYMECPECKKKSWQKKVLSKEIE